MQDNKRPSSVVFVAPFGLSPKGTASVRALPLARALVDRGHSVTLLVPPWNDRARSGQTWTDAGVRIVNLNVAPTPALDPPYLTAQLARRLWRAPPDILHTFKPKAYSGLIAALWWNLRRLWPDATTLIMDTDDWEGPGGWNELEPYPRPLQWLFAWQERYGLSHAHGVTAASRALEGLVWSHGVPPAQTCYIPNGPGAWSPPADDAVETIRTRHNLIDHQVVLLYTRFFEFELERIVRIWQQVVQAHPSARLFVVGTGLFGEEKRFAGMLSAAALDDTAVLAGWVPAEELSAYLALADLALYPMDDTLVNRTKCPVKLADLLAAGIPVVGDAVGQVREYLTDGAGVPVPAGNVERFTDSVVELLDAPERREQLSIRAKRRLHEHFAWHVQAARVEAFYNRLRG